jgi:hypothetical protein
MDRFLLLTVGTGNEADLEASLFTPLAKSVAAGEWGCVCLLPSRMTLANAQALEEGHGGSETFAVMPLPNEGDEEDPDASFAHFDSVIRAFLGKGIAPHQLTADFTRGTKAMSAALVLAAVRHGVPRLRYVSGPRDGRGMVIAGQERIREGSTLSATAARTLDLARGMMDQGLFAAVRSLLPDPDSPISMPFGLAEKEVRAARDLAAWLSAWDRLDYAAAARILRSPHEDLPAGWHRFDPHAEAVAWVASLRPGRVNDAALMRRTAVDLLANLERRVAHGQFEDALVRAYRIVELVAQARLVAAKEPIGRLRGRDDAIAQLRMRNDRLWRMLDGFDRTFPALKTANRNQSILIHGHGATATADAAQWEALSRGIEALLRQDRADAPDGAQAVPGELACARFPGTWGRR